MVTVNQRVSEDWTWRPGPWLKVVKSQRWNVTLLAPVVASTD
jgi:hypothetical protein